MKKLATVLLLVAGCRRQVDVGSAPVGSTPGATTPRAAVVLFMTAAKTQDLQAMSIVWGTTAGPARSTIEKNELEQREIILMCYLKHDSYQVLAEAPAPGGERVLALELKFKHLTRSTNFYATKGPKDRWYVRAFEPVESLRDICAKR